MQVRRRTFPDPHPHRRIRRRQQEFGEDTGIKQYRHSDRLNQRSMAPARPHAAATVAPRRRGVLSGRGLHFRDSCKLSSIPRPVRESSGVPLPWIARCWPPEPASGKRVFTSSPRLRIVMLAMAVSSASSRLQSSTDCGAIKTMTLPDSAASKPFVNPPAHVSPCAEPSTQHPHVGRTRPIAAPGEPAVSRSSSG